MDKQLLEQDFYRWVKWNDKEPQENGFYFIRSPWGKDIWLFMLEGGRMRCDKAQWPYNDIEWLEKVEAGATSSSTVKTLQGKVDFYRQETDKCREFVFGRNDIGEPCQPIWDAVHDKLQQQESTVKNLEREVERLKSGMERIERICLRDVTDMHKDFKHIYNIIQSITKTVNNDRE